MRKGDTVKMLSGKYRKKTGKVLSVDLKFGRVVVEGLNMGVRHERPKRSGEKGQKIQFPRAVSISKLMLICPECGKPTRVGYEVNEQGKKLRKCKKCGKKFI